MSIMYELSSDIYAEFGVDDDPEVLEEVNFLEGALLDTSLPSPITFIVTHTADEPPQHMPVSVTPLMSGELVKALQEIGVANLQCFPAQLRSAEDGTVWDDYFAVNVVGLVACADLEKSEYEFIIDRPGESSTPLLDFVELHVDPIRAGEYPMFRLAECPAMLLVNEKVVNYLRNIRPDEEWGITLIDVS
jgi:hypothetical protein